MSSSYAMDNIQIYWLGHASFMIETANLIIYTDPYQFKVEKPADLILITHEHFDHVESGILDKLRKPFDKAQGGSDTIFVIPAKSSLKVPGEAVYIKEGETTTQKGVEIKAVPAYNIGRNFHQRGFGVGYVIGVNGKKIYQTGDTDYIPEMEKLGDQSIDVMLVPICQTYVMDEKQASRAVKAVKPKVAIPMHYGTLADCSSDPNRFKELVGNAAQVVILEND